MSTIPGTSCLLTDIDDLPLCARPGGRARRATPLTPPHIPGDDQERAALAAVVGRPATLCRVCGCSLGELFTRRSRNGTPFCQLCADHAVAAYYARRPEARPTVTPPPARERTGTAYLGECDRYVVRYHAGHARWQIDDTQARRWTSRHFPAQADAETAAAWMNTLWREQVAHENTKGDA